MTLLETHRLLDAFWLADLLEVSIGAQKLYAVLCRYPDQEVYEQMLKVIEQRLSKSPAAGDE